MKQDNLAFGEASVNFSFGFKHTETKMTSLLDARVSQTGVWAISCLCICEYMRKNIRGLWLLYSDKILLWLASHMSKPQIAQHVFFRLTALKVI